MSQVQEVKEANDIVEIIGERVSLQRAGTYFKGLCPFHSEKSPSFFVSPDIQRFKCFGCGESGDAITFLEKYEGMSFVEALELLAERAGITLKKQTRTPEDNERSQLLEILELTKEYYHYLLTKHKIGQAGRDYLKSRQINQSSISLFQLGFAADSWDGLLTYLTKKKKYPVQLLEKAGLVIKGRGGRYYDRFRGRVIFPLRNHRGQVVGFSGRVLDPKIKEAKYINSPETELYHKSEMLFGYSELLQPIRKASEVIVVEGELDVITSAQAHVSHIVAVKGSALTEGHAKLLKRVVDRVILSLDSDDAGVEATKRAIEVLSPYGLEVRVAQVPDGKDPDELIKKDPQLWREAVKKTISVYAFLIKIAMQKHDTSTGEGKQAVIRDVGPVLAGIEHAVEQDFYVKQLAKDLAVREQLVREDLKRIQRHLAQRTKSKSKQPQSRERKNENDQVPPKKNGLTFQSRHERLEHYLIFLLLHAAPQVSDEQLGLMKRDFQELLKLTWQTQSLKTIMETYLQKGHNSLETLAQQLAEDQRETLFTVAYYPEFLTQLDTIDVVEEWQVIAKQLRQLAVRGKIDELSQRLRVLDSKEVLTTEEKTEQEQILKQVVSLRKQKA